MRSLQTSSVLALVAVALSLAVLQPAFSAEYENTSRRMAAGDFDNDGVNEVVYLNANGQLVVRDFNNATQGVVLPGTMARAVTAADMDGNGVPEITYINSATQGLESYNVATSTQATYPSGFAPFATLSANNVDADANHELLLLRTNDGVIRWDNAAGFTSPGGALRQIGAGDFRWGATDYEFVGRNAGSAPYAYDWGVGYLGLGGGLAYVGTGNVIADDPGGEIFASNAGGNVFVRKSSGGWVYTNGVTAPGVQHGIGTGRVDGDFAAGREMGYVIGGGGNLVYQSKTNWNAANGGSTGYQYLPTDASSSTGTAQGNRWFSDILLADIDNDGLDEIVTRRQAASSDSLHTYDNGDVGLLRASLSAPEFGNVALYKPVVAVSGEYSGSFPAQRVTDGRPDETFGQTYWLGREGVATEDFTVDLLGVYNVEQIVLRNTHNNGYNDRATKDFKVYASMDNASFMQILAGQLNLVAGGNGEQTSPVQLFNAANGLTPTQARYLKFESLTSWHANNNVGLNEFMVSEERNVALGAPVIDNTGAYSSSYSARRITDGNPTDTAAGGQASYWLGSNGDPTESVTVDLGQARDVKTLAFRNTHNDAANDRGTQDFRVLGSNDNVNFTPILEGKLSLSLGPNYDTLLPTDTFSFGNGLKPGSYRYLKFETLSSWFAGNHVGLNEIQVFEETLAANVATLKPVINYSGQYSSAFDVSKVTDMRLDEEYAGVMSYWIGRNNTPNEFFTLDLGGLFLIDGIELQNTHNRGYNDRGTREFEIWAATEVDGANNLINPQLILDSVMANRWGTGYDIPFDVFSAAAGDFAAFEGRYVQFVANSYWGVSSGLNEIRLMGFYIPEPSTFLIWALGLAATAWYAWRRRRRL